MLGLPTETEEDMKAIPELANDIAVRYYEIPKDQRNGKCQITISTSFFVPKPFTPFQWARMYPPEDYIGRAKVVNDTVKEQLNKKSIKYNWHEADVTVLEGVLARGDRKIGQAILKVYEKGGIFDAWSEYFDYQRWLDAFAECGIDPDFYTMRERSMDEIFPWDFIDTGVTKEFLKREWNNAMKETVTPNCRMRCSGCGVKKFGGGVCYENQKLGIIRSLFAEQTPERVIIFASSKLKVKEVTKALKQMKLNVGEMHSDLEQAQREEVMYEFKAGRINILVATDIVARGIDIDDIRLVINYDVPHDSEDYVHRIGRTARANNDGVALTFVNEKEQTNFKGIENFLEKEIYKIPVPEELGEAPEYKPRSNDGRKRSYKGGGRRNAGSGKGGNRNNSRRREGRPSSGTKKQE